MPASKKTQVKPKPSAMDGSFYCDGKPFTLPTKETRATIENRIINRIRIMGDDDEALNASGITLIAGRKLIKAALKNNQLSINIGLNPYDSEEEEKESSHHPMSPQYKYGEKGY